MLCPHPTPLNRRPTVQILLTLQYKTPSAKRVRSPAITAQEM